MSASGKKVNSRRILRRLLIGSLLVTTSVSLPLIDAAAQQPIINRYRNVRDRVLNRLAPMPDSRSLPGDQVDSADTPQGDRSNGTMRLGDPNAPAQSGIAEVQDNFGGRLLPPAGGRPFPLTRLDKPQVDSPSGQTVANSIDTLGTTAAPPRLPAGSSQPPINVATEEERNQIVAPDWKNPWVVLYITGKQSGYMEPCGCTGLENQKGGLMRRDSLLQIVKDKGWPVLPLDAGSQVRMRGKQSEVKFDWTSKAFSTMDYAAVAYGEDDLRLSQDTLVYQLINFGTDASGAPNPLFVSANVSIFEELDTKYKVMDVNGRKIGITTILGDESAAKLKGQADYAVIRPAAEALAEVMSDLEREKCDYHILIANASLEESKALAQKVPGFELVVTSGGYGEPTYRPEAIPGTNSQMVQVGTKGMYAGLVGLFDSPKTPMLYQRLALSSQFEDSPRIVELFHKYQDQLKAEGMERLGKRPQNHPTLREFVGSEKCGECHTSAFEVWKNSAHFHATESIVNPPERSIARNFDPECLSCHVTGWNPQEFFPYKTGFEQIDTTPHLTGNGCENCHGPGKNHVDAEMGDIEADAAMLVKLRQEMQLTMDKAQDKCLECHDIDNSPDFHRDGAFEEFWEKIKHYGKD